MKSLFTLSAICLFAVAVSAQQQYLLQPSDSPGSVEINESVLLRKISGQKVKLNRIKKGIEGYRIEIYQGGDRKAATEILERFEEEHPNVPADLVFESPYVKVKVGAYRSKLDAHKLYSTLKEEEYEVVKIVFVKGMQYPPLNCDDYELDDNGGNGKNKDAKVEEVDDF